MHEALKALKDPLCPTRGSNRIEQRRFKAIYPLTQSEATRRRGADEQAYIWPLRGRPTLRLEGLACAHTPVRALLSLDPRHVVTPATEHVRPRVVIEVLTGVLPPGSGVRGTGGCAGSDICILWAGIWDTRCEGIRPLAPFQHLSPNETQTCVPNCYLLSVAAGDEFVDELSTDRSQLGRSGVAVVSLGR